MFSDSLSSARGSGQIRGDALPPFSEHGVVVAVLRPSSVHLNVELALALPFLLSQTSHRPENKTGKVSTP